MYGILAVLAVLLGSFFRCYLSAWPFTVSFFHVAYGKGRWGWFTFGVFWKAGHIIVDFKRLLEYPETHSVLMSVFYAAFGVLFTLFFYRVVKLELRKRDGIKAGQ